MFFREGEGSATQSGKPLRPPMPDSVGYWPDAPELGARRSLSVPGADFSSCVQVRLHPGSTVHVQKHPFFAPRPQCFRGFQAGFLKIRVMARLLFY